MRLLNFLFKQLNDIKYGGIRELIKKIKLFFTYLIIFPLFIPAALFVLLVRIISPFLIIRVSPLDFSRIGAGYQLLWYLKLKRAGEFKQLRSLDLFFIVSKFKHNKHWLKLWKKPITIVGPSLFWKQFYIINKLFKGYEKFEIPNFQKLFILQNPLDAKKNKKFMNGIKKESLKKMVQVNDTFIDFKKKEIEVGRNYLKKIGTTEYNFICFHARDSAYLKRFDNKRDWNYHNFRDCNIFNYIFSMQEMSKKNFYSFRMGSVVNDKLKNIDSKIIDYANSKDQSDFLDIYLGSRCFFSVYSDAGISVVPETFNRPIAFVNWPEITVLANCNNSLFIPKKYYSTKEQRFLTFKEIIRLKFNNQNISKSLHELNIKAVENTPEEINEAVSEIYSRLSGTWKEGKGEEELQNRFWSLFNFSFVRSPTFRIGSDFLKKNQNLLA